MDWTCPKCQRENGTDLIKCGCGYSRDMAAEGYTLTFWGWVSPGEIGEVEGYVVAQDAYVEGD